MTVSPWGVPATTWSYRTGYASELSAAAGSSRSATGRITVVREVRQTAARPSSQIMYWGLITRLVVVNSRIAVRAASNGVAAVQRWALTRHRSSQPRATTVSSRARWPRVETYGPTYSKAP